MPKTAKEHSAKDLEFAQDLATRMGASCTDALLAWGQSINEYEATPDDHPAKQIRLTLVQKYGEEALRLGRKLAAILRPTKA